MITHHPDIDLLFDYATGSLTQGLALAIAAHNALCPSCQRQANALLNVGGLLLESAPSVDIEADSLDRLLDRLDEPEPARVSISAAFDEETLRTVPAPLLSFLPASLKDLPWKGVGRMLEEFRLSLARSDIKATLMRLRPGSQMPEHTHRGQEFTLLLAGGYRDSNKQFGPGDFDAKDSSQAHQPVVDDDGPCLAFAVLDAPLRLTGTMGKLINPFLRF